MLTVLANVAEGNRMNMYICKIEGSDETVPMKELLAVVANAAKDSGQDDGWENKIWVTLEEPVLLREQQMQTADGRAAVQTVFVKPDKKNISIRLSQISSISVASDEMAAKYRDVATPNAAAAVAGGIEQP